MGNTLYVLLLPKMEEDLTLGYTIKIGFSENFEKRFKSGYGSYFIYVKILHLYHGDFTKDDELVIKHYFSGHKIYRDEYYEYCPEIIDFFNTYDTPEKLKNRIDTIPFKKRIDNTRKHHEVNYYLLDYVVNSYHNDLEFIEKQELWDSLFDILKRYSTKNQENYLMEEYKFDINEYNNYIRSIPKTYNSNIKLALKKFNSIGQKREKFRFLIKYSESSSKDDFNVFLKLIPGKYRDYYNIAGYDIIKSSSCLESRMKQKWRIQTAKRNASLIIEKEIYDCFIIGQSYTNSEICLILDKLYKKANYSKIPNPSEIKQFFIVLHISIKNSSGIYENGFKILEKF
jgi:hypothetical protein